MRAEGRRRTPAQTLRARAFAKLNLTLRVVGVRSDGYHDLRSVFQTIALHDTLSFAARPGPLTITSTDPACPTGRDNLVWAVAEQVWRAAGRRGAPANVAVHIRKRIPMQSGLGGGSSDAAAAILGFEKLWRVPLDAAARRRIAVSTGADVPFFLQGGTALGLDRGDLLFPLSDAAPATVVLVVPPFGVSTREAYGWFDHSQAGFGRDRRGGRVDPAHSGAVRTGRTAPVWLDQVLPDTELGNDLEGPVADRRPEIRRIAVVLREAGARYSAMTGSGSAVFGLFDSPRPAAAAVVRLARGGWRAVRTSLLNRRAYKRLSAVYLPPS